MSSTSQTPNKSSQVDLEDEKNNKRRQFADKIREFVSNLINIYDYDEFHEYLDKNIELFTQELDGIKSDRRYVKSSTALDNLEEERKKLEKEGIENNFLQDGFDRSKQLDPDFSKVKVHTTLEDEINTKDQELVELRTKIAEFSKIEDKVKQRELLRKQISKTTPQATQSQTAIESQVLTIIDEINDSIKAYNYTYHNEALIYDGKTSETSFTQYKSSLESQLKILSDELTNMRKNKTKLKADYGRFKSRWDAIINQISNITKGNTKDFDTLLNFNNFSIELAKETVELYEEVLSILSKVKGMSVNNRTMFDDYVLYLLRRDKAEKKEYMS